MVTSAAEGYESKTWRQSKQTSRVEPLDKSEAPDSLTLAPFPPEARQAIEYNRRGIVATTTE